MNEFIGKEITPRRRAIIIAYRCLKDPMTFRQIEHVTGISKSTVSDIWRHALSNARKLRLETTCSTQDIAPRSTLSFTNELDPDRQFSLLELIDFKVLNPTIRSGRPKVFSEREKDKLVAFVKQGFETRRMSLRDIRREAGFLYVCDGTIFNALKSREVHAYRELFKFILSEENKKKRLVSRSSMLRYPSTNYLNFKELLPLTSLLVARTGMGKLCIHG